MRSIILACLVASAGWSASLKEQLSFFADLSPSDSIVALHSRPGAVEASIQDTRTHEIRTVSTPLNEVARNKLLDQAKLENIPVDDAVATPAQPASISEQALSRQYRKEYFRNEFSTSLVLYGYGLPFVFQNSLSATALAGLEILAIPGTYLGHSIFAANREWNQGNVYGIQDATSMAFWGSAVFGALVGGADITTYQIGFGAAMVSYPFAVYLGYGNGSGYADNPGRLSMRTNIASDAATAALLFPFLFIDHFDNPDGFVRMEGAVAVAGYFGGHFLANTWKPGEHVPLGNPQGISQWGVLGAAAGEELAALADVQGIRSNFAFPLAGYVAGLGAGWFAFQSRNDAEDRAFYNDLGLTGGTLTGLGVWLLTGAQDTRGSVTSYLVGGAFAGYLLSNALTSHMLERTSPKPRTAWLRNVSINPIPVLALANRPDGTTERVWEVPGLQVRFR